MDLATGVVPSKQPQFDNGNPPDTETMTAPLALAKRSLKRHSASLPSEAAALLLRLGTKILSQRLRLHQRRAQATKLDDDPALIPRSAQIKFALNPSKASAQAPEFLTLQRETEQLITDIQLQLKSKVISMIRLDLQTSQALFLDDFVSALRLATHALALLDPALNPAQLDQICTTLLAQHSELLLRHLETPVNDIQQRYCRVHSIPVLPNPYPEPVTPNHLHDRLPIQAHDQEDPVLGFAYLPADPPRQRVRQRPQPTPQCLAISSLARRLAQLFVDPWDLYLDADKKLSINRQILQMAVAHFDTAATANAAMLVDAEAPADCRLLQDLIKEAVSKSTKALQHNIKTLRNHQPPSTP